MATDSGEYDQATLQRRYAMAQALMNHQTPIKHWAEGLGNVAESALGGYQLSKLDDERRSEKAAGRGELFAALGLPAPPTAAPEASQGGFQKIAALLSGGGAGVPAASPVAPVAPAAVPPIAPAKPVMPAGPVPQVTAPVVGSRAEVMPTAKTWGDKEAEDAGLYEPKTKIAAALTPPPAGGPTDVSAIAKPPAVATTSGILSGVPDEKKAQIAMMLTSKNPQVKSVGQALMSQAMAASDTPKYDFKTAGDSLYRTNAKTGTAEPIRDVGRSVQPMTPAQRKEWNVPDGMSAGIDDNGKPVFSPPGTNINLNTQTDALKKVQATAIEDMQTANSVAREATKRTGIWDSMEQAAQGFKPGATADIKLSAGRYLKDLGITAGDGVPDAEVFKQMQQQIAIHAQPKGQGAVSNSERELFAKAIPNITMSPEALQKSIQISRSLDNFDRKVASIYRDSTKKNGGVPNSVEINDEIDKLGSPLSPADTSFLNKAASKSGSAVSSSDTSVQTATNPKTGEKIILKDGQWMPVK